MYDERGIVSPVRTARYTVELFRIRQGREKKTTAKMSLADMAARIRQANGRMCQFRAETFEEANIIEESLRRMDGISSCRDGRLVTAWELCDVNQMGKKLALLGEDGWVALIRQWMSEEPGRSSRDITSTEVAARALNMPEASRSELIRVAKCLRSMGYAHVVIGNRRINAWRPPR